MEERSIEDQAANLWMEEVIGRTAFPINPPVLKSDGIRTPPTQKREVVISEPLFVAEDGGPRWSISHICKSRNKR